MLIGIGNYDPSKELEQELDFKLHLRIKSRSRRKYITTVQGFPDNYDVKSILQMLKTNLACGGTVKTNDETDEKYIMLAGDKRDDIQRLFVEHNVCDEKDIIMHGY